MQTTKKMKKRGPTMVRTFRYWPIPSSDLTALDLRGEGEEGMQAYRIEILNEAGEPVAERADALYAPRSSRLGIAWGADATWANVDDLEGGIELWLNDAQAWELLR